MKKLIHNTILIICLGLLPTIIRAQANQKHTTSINFGPEIFAPENFWDTHRVGGGISLKAEYTFGKHASATFNTGLTHFAGKRQFEDFTSPEPKFYKPIVAIPLKAGARYYIGNFYVSGEAGIIVMTNFSNTTKAVFSAGLGDKIKIGRKYIDISGRQEIWLGKNNEQYNMAVLRVAYEIVW